ncbi:MAG: hypothetical protein EBZ69_06375 [Alphaproteobacteria bacterium]|nr:hypothetical protein [Alphaproteobacteria bacterium]NDC56419.1 hypothetical protein [Alphaproteobacteria bacterium]
MTHRLISFTVLALMLVVIPLAGCSNSPWSSSNDTRSEPERLIDVSANVSEQMFRDPEYGKLVELVSRARGVLIFPSVLRGAFIFGARGGNGVLLARDAAGGWSAPAFYSIGGVNWGLQFGGQSQSIVIAIMTERGLNAIMNRRATLGVDANVAAGPVGKSIAAQTGADWKADMYAFAKSEGVFIGIALDGSIVWPRHEFNQQLYGASATPEGILLQNSFSSQRASQLIGVLP